jgi:hypothetical protein
MKTIWKFPIETTHVQNVSMPEGARILSVNTQMDKPCIWAVVETENKPQMRTFKTYGTGHGLPEHYAIDVYVGTYLVSGDSLVFHVFETF